MSTIVLNCGQKPADVAIAAPTTQVFIKLGYVARFSIDMQDNGADAITAITFAKSIMGAEYGVESASIGGITPVPGADKINLSGINECMDMLRLTLACKKGTTVRFSFGGV
jgi:hypothetical protein